MPATLTPILATDAALLEPIVSHSSLEREFDVWQGPGRVQNVLDDPLSAPRLRWILRVGEVAAGFACVFVAPGVTGPWSVVRLGVIEPHRRGGLATRLLAEALEGLRREFPDCREVCLNAWIPNDAAAAFAACHGFRHARYFWLMERPRGAAPDPELPDGVTLRTFDGTERALADWNDAYNASFARHYHYIVSDLETARALTAAHGFRPDGLALAYRDGRCVGFCRNVLYAGRGEVGVLGVVPEARRLGLGRSLLRWGVAWLEREDVPHVTLLVDGENESAIELYRREGFEVTRTRQIWSREI